MFSKFFPFAPHETINLIYFEYLGQRILWHSDPKKRAQNAIAQWWREREGGKKCISTWIGVFDMVVGEICENFSFLSPAPWRLQHRTFFLYGENCSRIVGCWAHRRENPQSDRAVREREWVSCCRVESTFWISMAGNRFCHPHNNSRDSPWFSMQKRKAFCKVRNWKFLSTLFVVPVRCCERACHPRRPMEVRSVCWREEMKIYDNSLQSIPYCEWNEMKWNGKEKKRVKWSDSEPTREDSWNQSWNSFEIKFHELMLFDIYPTFFFGACQRVSRATHTGMERNLSFTQSLIVDRKLLKFIVWNIRFDASFEATNKSAAREICGRDELIK